MSHSQVLGWGWGSTDAVQLGMGIRTGIFKGTRFIGEIVCLGISVVFSLTPQLSVLTCTPFLLIGKEAAILVSC